MSEALANTRPFVHLHIHTEYVCQAAGIVFGCRAW